MDVLQAIFLALIQGITEFLPISSSAHLILPGRLLGWPDQGLAFDTSVHLGSLVAVIIYFRRQLLALMTAVFRHLALGQKSRDSDLAYQVLIASLPIIPVGFATRFLVETELRSIEVIATTTIVFGMALWLADHYRRAESGELTNLKALGIGIAQCFALIPGTSRSGVTITMALLLGQSRAQAARISFLIAIPAIAGAAALKFRDVTQAQVEIQWTGLIIGTLVAAVSAYACIAWLLKVVESIGYLPFVLYRLILGVLLIVMIT